MAVLVGHPIVVGDIGSSVDQPDKHYAGLAPNPDHLGFRVCNYFYNPSGYRWEWVYLPNQGGLLIVYSNIYSGTGCFSSMGQQIDAYDTTNGYWWVAGARLWFSKCFLE